jgi:asparagine synthase (glutamine-hydrolysing)
MLVMEMTAKAGVRVLLNGQGADELFAGYPSSVGPYLRSLAREQGWRYALGEASAESAGAGGLRRLLEAEAGRLLAFVPQPIATRFTRRHHRGELALLARDFARPSPHGRLGAGLQEHLRSSRAESPLPLFLRLEDIHSSAYSLEARLPFLDPRVVAFARAAPARMLRRHGLNKYLLRAMLPGMVADTVLQRRDKMGFPVPHGRWLRGPLRPMLDDVLSASSLGRRGWYDVPGVRRRVDELLGSDSIDVEQGLLRILLLEQWARTRLDAFHRRA